MTTADIKVRVTRRPNGKQRKLKLVTTSRLKNLTAPLDLNGVDGLADIPVIGIIVMAFVVLLFAMVLAIFFGGLIIALAELLIIGALALAGTLWAWARGHPKVAVADIGDARWIRPDGPSVNAVYDEVQLRKGTPPDELGYQPTD